LFGVADAGTMRPTEVPELRTQVVNASDLGRPSCGAALVIFFISLLALGCPGFGTEGAEGDFSDIPEEPTWQDVKPLLDAYCNECHSVPPALGAPGGFRYDVCEDTGSEAGAATFAGRIQVRTVDELPSPMPPSNYTAQPSPEDKEMLRRWVENGAPCGGGS
jgi:uncharacterized membrane protein